MRFLLPGLGVLVALATAGCGSSPTSAVDGGGRDGSPADGTAGDASATDGSTGDAPATDGSTGDAPAIDGGAGDGAAYQACFDPNTGQVIGSLKTCTSAADCVTRTITQCCGVQLLEVGVSNAGAPALDACLAAMPDCGARGCATFPGTQAEDGKTAGDGGTIQVACTQLNGGPMECWTSVH